MFLLPLLYLHVQVNGGVRDSRENVVFRAQREWSNSRCGSMRKQPKRSQRDSKTETFSTQESRSTMYSDSFDASTDESMSTAALGDSTSKVATPRDSLVSKSFPLSCITTTLTLQRIAFAGTK